MMKLRAFEGERQIPAAALLGSSMATLAIQIGFRHLPIHVFRLMNISKSGEVFSVKVYRGIPLHKTSFIR